MSKFRKSKFSTEEISWDVLTFLQLDVVASWLMDETVALCEDFHTKSEFVRDQQKTILNNEKSIHALHDIVKKVHNVSAEVEVEIKLLDEILDECSNRVRTLNTISCLQPCIQGGQGDSTVEGKYERQVWLEMLQNTDNTMQKLQSLHSDMQELQMCSELQLNPYKVIIKVLECHCEALKNTEKNLDTIMDKILMIDRIFHEIREQWNVNKTTE